jgi:uncharacterized LabA/DUF88 family protein
MKTIQSTDKVALFIDGANLHAAVRALGFEIDFQKLRAMFASNGTLVRAYYYTALVEDQEFSPLKPLIDWLEYNGYSLVTKAAKEFTDPQGRRRIKGNMDVEIAVDMLEMAPQFDHIILFSGDGDFRCLVAAVQRKGCQVTVVSSVRTSPSMVADELRRQCDTFIDLADLKKDIARARKGGQRENTDEDRNDIENSDDFEDGDEDDEFYEAYEDESL